MVQVSMGRISHQQNKITLNVQFPVWSVQCAVCSAQCSVCCVQYAVCSVPCNVSHLRHLENSSVSCTEALDGCMIFFAERLYNFFVERVCDFFCVESSRFFGKIILGDNFFG